MEMQTVTTQCDMNSERKGDRGLWHWKQCNELREETQMQSSSGKPLGGGWNLIKEGKYSQWTLKGSTPDGRHKKGHQWNLSSHLKWPGKLTASTRTCFIPLTSQQDLSSVSQYSSKKLPSLRHYWATPPRPITLWLTAGCLGEGHSCSEAGV